MEGGKIPGVGNPTSRNITQPPGSENENSAEQKPVKTGKGQKVSKLSKLKNFFSKRNNKSEGKEKAEQTLLAKRDTRLSESANSVTSDAVEDKSGIAGFGASDEDLTTQAGQVSLLEQDSTNDVNSAVKGRRDKTSNDHGSSIAFGEGYVEAFAGTEGMVLYGAMKFAEDISAVRDSGLSIENVLESSGMENSGMENSGMENSALEEGERLLQILKDSAEAGIVRDDIEALVDASQTGLNQAVDLKESIGVQKDSVTEALGEKEGLLATAEESQ
nr:hypothetical protein [Endozoicomonas sp.]